MVCIKGSGQLKRRMRSKAFLKSFYDTWDRIYLSMDGLSLYLYLSRNASEPIACIPLAHIKTLHIEMFLEHFWNTSRFSDGSKKEKLVDDRFYVIITTLNNDISQIK
jgi:hypothetical protein